MPGEAASAGVSTSANPSPANQARIAARTSARRLRYGRRAACRSGRHQGIFAPGIVVLPLVC